MIVTRSWLQEFVNIEDITNEELYKTFNSIGLEVDSIKNIEIPSQVVVGKILSCQKHPDADKLNVCQIDVGDGVAKQIVCGAANVVDAQFVAVALIGAKLPNGLEIQFANLRGVESYGMVCSTGELGLPEIGKGIMILDESIGDLQIGRELGSYKKIADSIIELELTANRGDCLSVYGVARDLSVALQRDLQTFEHKVEQSSRQGIARFVDLHTSGEIDVDLQYHLIQIAQPKSNLLISLRLAMLQSQLKGVLYNILSYVTHSTGVILRAYELEAKSNSEEKYHLTINSDSHGHTVRCGEKLLGIVGCYQEPASIPKNDAVAFVLLEASYIHPDVLVEVATSNELPKDALYYNTSRGSEPNLQFGLDWLFFILKNEPSLFFYGGDFNIKSSWEPKRISVDIKDVSAIIGETIEMSKTIHILQKLKFELHGKNSDHLLVTVPRFRHDIKNIQDITEEIVRIIGIDNISAKPLEFTELNRITNTTHRYKFKRSLRNAAVAAGLYENVSYIFTDRTKLVEYGFEVVEEALDLTNPIIEELNTLRTTHMINLLNAVNRNVSYTEKSIWLFEIGAIYNSKREQREVLSVIMSGQSEVESIANSGKPKMVDFGMFVKKMGSIIGSFELAVCSVENKLLHPYQSADIYCRGVKCGYLSKLHPTAQENYDIYDTFIAQVDIDAIMPRHINVHPVSRFQGVYKDLSFVIDKSISFGQVSKDIAVLDLKHLQRFYPVDVYEDTALGEKKSLTIRFFIQSLETTLQESDIDEVIRSIIERLEQACQAVLR